MTEFTTKALQRTALVFLAKDLVGFIRPARTQGQRHVHQARGVMINIACMHQTLYQWRVRDISRGRTVVPVAVVHLLWSIWRGKGKNIAVSEEIIGPSSYESPVNLSNGQIIHRRDMVRWPTKVPFEDRSLTSTAENPSSWPSHITIQ